MFSFEGVHDVREERSLRVYLYNPVLDWTLEIVTVQKDKFILEHELEFVRQFVMNNVAKCECRSFVVQECGVAAVLEMLEMCSW